MNAIIFALSFATVFAASGLSFAQQRTCGQSLQYCYRISGAPNLECYKNYQTAQQTGIWPAYGTSPAFACRPDAKAAAAPKIESQRDAAGRTSCLYWLRACNRDFSNAAMCTESYEHARRTGYWQGNSLMLTFPCRFE